MQGIAGEQQNGAAFQTREPRDDRSAEIGSDLEERALVDYGVDDRAHLVDLTAAARHRFHQRFLGALGIVSAGNGRRQVIDRRRQVGQKAPGAVERLLFGIDRIIDAAGAGLDVGAAKFLLRQILAKPVDDRRAAAHRKIIADHHDGAAVDPGAAEYAVSRRQVLEFAVLVILADAGDRADLVKSLLIDQSIDALTNGEPALVALSLDLVNASHLARERFAPGEVVELRLPVHSSPPSR